MSSNNRDCRVIKEIVEVIKTNNDKKNKNEDIVLRIS